MGRYIALEAKINDEKYFIVNIYAPNKDSESAKFYDHLINVFKKDDRKEMNFRIREWHGTGLNTMLDYSLFKNQKVAQK